MLLSLEGGKKHSFFLDSDKSSCGDITESVALIKWNPGRKHLSPKGCLDFTMKAGSPGASCGVYGRGLFPSFLGVQGCGIKVAEGVEKKSIYFNIWIKKGGNLLHRIQQEIKFIASYTNHEFLSKS